MPRLESALVALEGLEPGTTYHYWLVAYKEEGTVHGEEQTFTTAAATPPLVTTGEASDVTQTTATITGTVDTKGLQTSYGFEIGTDTNYGPATEQDSIGGATTEEVHVTLSDLQPGTTYHYRLCATNEDGTSCGAEGTFTTLSFASPIVQPPTLALLSIPPGAFALQPSPSKPTTKKKPPTNAQKLSKALKACHEDKKKGKRAGCEKQARKKYGAVKKERK